MALMLEHSGDAAQIEGAVPGPTPLRSTRSVHDKRHLRVLPPSANWYCSKICDWGHCDTFGHLFAYGAKSNVFIYQVASNGEEQEAAKTSGSRVKVSFFAQLVRGKRDRRVTAVQFVTDSTGKLRLVCAGEEGSVQIWDVATRTMVEQHRKHKAEITAVTVSGILDANFVVAGDRQGRISVWERDAGKVAIFTPISGDGVHSMASSPQDKALVAVGYRSGVLCLVDVALGSVRHRLDGHDQEVQCLAWKQSTLKVCNRGGDEDTCELDLLNRTMWLASSSRDKSIKVWKVFSNATVEPSLDQVLRLPTSKQGMSFSQTKQLWLPVAWNHSSEGKHSLWSGSFDGTLFFWEWNVVKALSPAKTKGDRRNSCKPVVVKGGHNRMLFSIVMAPLLSSAMDKEAFMLTVSLDREVRLWKVSSKSKSSGEAVATCSEKMAGLGGHAYSVSYNTATSDVAAGVGDQTVRLWKLDSGDSISVKNDYDCDLLWKGLQSKVTCVRWHPLQHAILAYGTEDGRIGLYDVQSKKYSHFRASHDHEVQQLEWRMVCPEKDCPGDTSSFLDSIKQLETAQEQGQTLEDALLVQNGHSKKQDDDLKVLLWSRDAGGQIFESNPDVVDHNSKKVMFDCVACSWDDQYQLVAIGRSNGSVEILSWEESPEGTGTTVHRFHEHLEAVTCVAWSKDAGIGLLASGGQDGQIFVYSYGTVATNLTNKNALDGVTREKRVLGVLSGHSSKITCLKWCSDTTKELLASTSADGTVQVWNALSMQREALFGYHVGRVLSVDWVSPYSLITGGEDQTLRLWDYRIQQKDALSKKHNHIKAKQPQLVQRSPASLHTDHELAQSNVNRADNDNGTAVPTSISAGKCESKPGVKKIKKKKTMIFHVETELTKADILSAVSEVVLANDGETSGTKDNLLIGRNRAGIQGFLATEAASFRDESEWENLANVLLLQGDVAEALRVVAKEGALNATWLAYAPMAGMDVWREMTNLYALQLDAQGDKKAAAFHFLSIGKVRSAANCLTSADAYKEALALIRLRLGPHDPLHHDVLWRYAEFLTRRGRHEESALVLLNIGSTKAKAQAVRALVRTGDLQSVKTALEVLRALVDPQTTGGLMDDTEQPVGGEMTFPASYFISIAGHAITKSNFDVAESAGKLLLSRAVAVSSLKPPASHRLVHCLLRILKALDDFRLCRESFDVYIEDTANGRVDKVLQSDVPKSVRDFFSVLIRPQKGVDAKNFYGLGPSAGFLARGLGAAGRQENWLSRQIMVNRADQFWSQVLTICQHSGYWFDTEGEVHVQEAQELLVETNCFDDIENAATVVPSGEPVGYAVTALKASQHLLRFVMEIMSSSFVGALEHMRELLLLIQPNGANGGDSTYLTPSNSEVTSPLHPPNLCIDVMTLLCPSGFVSPKDPPQCGELSDEQHDAAVLWSSVLLAQCSIVLSSATLQMKGLYTEQDTQSLDTMLRLLRSSFLEEDASLPLSPGLMDAGNQGQLEALLNDVLVAAHQIPDDSIGDLTNDERTDEVKVNGHDSTHCQSSQSRKQFLIDGANDVRSRLTWNGCTVKQ